MARLNADVSYVLRVAVIVLRVFCGHKFVVIRQKLNLDDRMVSQIYKRALQHTLESLRDLLFGYPQTCGSLATAGQACNYSKKIRSIYTIKATIS